MGNIPFRRIYMLFGSILALILGFLIDPDSTFVQNLPMGASTIVMLAAILKAVLFVAFLHLSRKGLYDYIVMGEVYRKAMESPVGAGLFAISIALAMIAIALCVIASGFIG